MAKAAQDINRFLNAGSGAQVQVPGEFIYCKFTESPIRVTIGNTQNSVVMEAGDKIRLDQPFSDFRIENVGDYPTSIVLVVGWGDYWRQIIQGEVAVRPSIRGEDGRLRSDTRRDVGLYVDIRPDRIEESAGQYTKYSNFWPDNAVSVAVSKDFIAGGTRSGWSNPRISVRDRASTVPVFGVSNGGEEAMESGEAVVGLAFDDRRKLMVALTDQSDDRFLYVWSTVTWQFEQRFQYPERVYGLAFVPSRNEFVVRHDPFFNDGKLVAWKYHGNTWEMVRESPVAPTLRGGIAYYAGLIWALDKGSAAYETYDPETLEKVGEGSFGSGFGVYGADGEDETGRIWVVAADKHLRYRLPEDIVRAGQVGATLDGCAIPGLLTPDLRYTTANVTLERTPDGGVFASGEVVKAVVEAYLGYGVRVPDDYLDHVYGITFPDGRRIESGYESFAAASITDDFYVEFPGRVVLTLDVGL